MCQGMLRMWWSLFVLLTCCAPALAFSASAPSEWLQDEDIYQEFTSIFVPEQYPRRSVGEQMVTILGQTKRPQASGDSPRRSEEGRKLTMRDQTREAQSSGSSDVSSASDTEDSDYAGDTSTGTSNDTSAEEEAHSGYDKAEEPHQPHSPGEQQQQNSVGQGFVSSSKLVGRGSDAEKEEGSSLVLFVRPTSPRNFVGSWPEQKLLFESLSHPFSPEQRRNLQCAYYPFTAAGKLLEELGREAFLKRFGKGSIDQMRMATTSEMKQRKAAELVARNAEGGIPKIQAFVAPRTPKDFVKCWPEQKRLFESLPRPRPPGQKRILQATYYRFTAAGQLLEELGKKEFLQRFGEGPVSKMERATTAELKQRKEIERDGQRQITGPASSKAKPLARSNNKSFKGKEEADDVPTKIGKKLAKRGRCEEADNQEETESDESFDDDLHPAEHTARDGRTKDCSKLKVAGPVVKNRVERGGIVRIQQLGGRKTLRVSLSRNTGRGQTKRLRPEGDQLVIVRGQTKVPRSSAPEASDSGSDYADDASVEESLNMSFKEKSTNERDQVEEPHSSHSLHSPHSSHSPHPPYDHDVEEEKATGVVEFTWPRSPKEFVKCWPERKRLFQSLPHPFSPEQERILKNVYYPFTAAGQLLEELGEQEFLEQYGESSAGRMQRTTSAELRQRRAAERDQKAVESEKYAESEAVDIRAFRRPRSPADFVKIWPGQKCLYQRLPHPICPEHKRVLHSVYYPFGAAGQLLEEIGEKAFLKRFGKSSAKRMQKTAAAEVKPRKARTNNLVVADTGVEGANGEEDPDADTKFAWPKTPARFVKRWSQQKRLFQSLPYYKTPEQRRELKSVYYPFTAAGQLLEELGEEEFLRQFDRGSVKQMQRATVAEMKRKREAQRAQEGITERPAEARNESRTRSKDKLIQENGKTGARSARQLKKAAVYGSYGEANDTEESESHAERTKSCSAKDYSRSEIASPMPMPAIEDGGAVQIRRQGNQLILQLSIPKNAMGSSGKGRGIGDDVQLHVKTSADDQMERSCDQMEGSCAQMKGLCDQMEGSCDHMEGSYDQMEGSCDNMEGSCDQMKGSCDNMERSCDQMKGSCDQMEGSCDHMEGSFESSSSCGCHSSDEMIQELWTTRVARQSNDSNATGWTKDKQEMSTLEQTKGPHSPNAEVQYDELEQELATISVPGQAGDGSVKGWAEYEEQMDMPNQMSGPNSFESPNYTFYIKALSKLDIENALAGALHHMADREFFTEWDQMERVNQLSLFGERQNEETDQKVLVTERLPAQVCETSATGQPEEEQEAIALDQTGGPESVVPADEASVPTVSAPNVERPFIDFSRYLTTEWLGARQNRMRRTLSNEESDREGLNGQESDRERLNGKESNEEGSNRGESNEDGLNNVVAFTLASEPCFELASRNGAMGQSVEEPSEQERVRGLRFSGGFDAAYTSVADVTSPLGDVPQYMSLEGLIAGLDQVKEPHQPRIPYRGTSHEEADWNVSVLEQFFEWASEDGAAEQLEDGQLSVLDQAEMAHFSALFPCEQQDNDDQLAASDQVGMTHFSTPLCEQQDQEDQMIVSDLTGEPHPSSDILASEIKDSDIASLSTEEVRFTECDQIEEPHRDANETVQAPTPTIEPEQLGKHDITKQPENIQEAIALDPTVGPQSSTLIDSIPDGKDAQNEAVDAVPFEGALPNDFSQAEEPLFPCGQEGGNEAVPGIVEFTTFKSPKDFVKRWSEQKRLYQSLPHPLVPGQKRVLDKTYYKFIAAGRLLEELGKKAFLKRYGNGFVTGMRKAVVAEIKQRAAEEDRDAEDAESARDAEDEESARDAEACNISSPVVFVRPKSPKDFVRCWPEQKRLFEKLPYPRTPEQDRMLRSTYYRFAAAGQLFEELGKKEFLKRFGEGTVKQMRKAAAAGTKERKAAKKKMASETIKGAKEERTPELSIFVRPTSPKDFAERWPEQKCVFKSLPRCKTPAQRRALNQVYYRFAAAGQLLDELGEEEFLNRFEKGSVTQMQRDAIAEIKQRKAVRKGRGVVENELADKEQVVIVNKSVEKGQVMIANKPAEMEWVVLLTALPEANDQTKSARRGQQEESDVEEESSRGCATQGPNLTDHFDSTSASIPAVTDSLPERRIAIRTRRRGNREIEYCLVPEATEMNVDELHYAENAVKDQDKEVHSSGSPNVESDTPTSSAADAGPLSPAIPPDMAVLGLLAECGQIEEPHQDANEVIQERTLAIEPEHTGKYNTTKQPEEEREEIAPDQTEKLHSSASDSNDGLDEAPCDTFAEGEHRRVEESHHPHSPCGSTPTFEPEETGEHDATKQPEIGQHQVVSNQTKVPYLRADLYELAAFESKDSDSNSPCTEKGHSTECEQIEGLRQPHCPYEPTPIFEPEQIGESHFPDDPHAILALEFNGTEINDVHTEAQVDTAAILEQVSEGSITKEGAISNIVLFVKPETPKDFVGCWPEQKRLFENLLRPFSSEQKRILDNSYYQFAAAGKLLDELGEKAFLEEFGKGSVTQMRAGTKATTKQRKAADKSRKGVVDIVNADGEGVLEVAKLIRPQSPKDFVERWLKQKLLVEGPPHPLSTEQKRILMSAHYPFKAAGQLLEELGKKAFLKRFGKSSVDRMRKDALADVRQRKAVEKDQEMAKGGEHAKGKGLGVVTFIKPKTPKELVERWSEQKSLFESLPHPRTPEQARMLENTYAKFAPAGRLLEELGEVAFLQRFGKSSVTQMREAIRADNKQKKAVARDREMTEGMGDVEVDALGIVTFAWPKSPKGFVKRWPEQKRRFESLPRPFSPEQKRALVNGHYPFSAAGQLLEELGEEAFLQKFGGLSVKQMQKAAAAEPRPAKKRGNNRNMDAVDVEGEVIEPVPGIVAFVRPSSPKDFAENWPEQKRLYESLPRPLSPEQKRVLNGSYYQFVAAGKLLEELGKEAFLEKFGGGSTKQMRADTIAAAKQRKTAEENQEGAMMKTVKAKGRPRIQSGGMSAKKNNKAGNSGRGRCKAVDSDDEEYQE